MPFSVEALAIVLVVGFFGIALAVFVDSLPAIRIFSGNLLEGINELKKFRKQKPF